MSLPFGDHDISNRIKRAAAQIAETVPGRTAHFQRRPRRPWSGRLASAGALAFLLAAGTGFSVGRATDGPSVPAPSLNNRVVQTAVEWVLQSLAAPGGAPITVTHITSIQVKVMTEYQFTYGIGSAWKGGGGAGCDSAAHAGPPTAAFNRAQLYVIAIYAQWTILQQNLGSGDIVPARHYSVATLRIPTSGLPTSDTGFGFPPVSSDGAPLCWGLLPNAAP